MELLDLIIVFGIAFLSFIDIIMVGLPDGFIRAPALPPFRTGKGWSISVPLYSYNNGKVH